MSPTSFPEANTTIGPPPGVPEEHVATIPGFVATMNRGPHDGASVTVTAWQPDEEDRQRIAQGAPVFLLSLGGLLPHSLSTCFPLRVE